MTTCVRKTTESLVKKVMVEQLRRNLQTQGIYDKADKIYYEQVSPSIYVLPLMKVSIDYTFFVLRSLNEAGEDGIVGAIIIGEDAVSFLLYKDDKEAITDVHIWFSSFVVSQDRDVHTESILLSDPSCFDKIEKAISYTKNVWM